MLFFFLFSFDFYYLLNFELKLLLHNDNLSEKNKHREQRLTDKPDESWRDLEDLHIAACVCVRICVG